ncbi:Protoporphyrinogen oxidase chloroplastic [Taenia crassiceps]|uniref:Protoporphyrinogen oxidase chloroplastic n=1 Tax=Taenia crassiceps TaxID=6207 RepID=A0ABR4QAA9_9CEST
MSEVNFTLAAAKSAKFPDLFFANPRSTPKTRSFDCLTRSSFKTNTLTLYPAPAQMAAIPEPIKPQPITATLPTNLLRQCPTCYSQLLAMARCTVVGGGLSGLSTAYLLSRLPQNQVGHVSVYEANNIRFGGCFLTDRNPHTGALHDLGPHSARIATPSTSPLLRLVSSLGFTHSEVYWLPPLKRYIYAAGALRTIGLFSFKTEPPFTRSHLALFIRRALTKGPGPLKEDISVDEYLRTRFDSEFADYLGSALMRGVCGVDSKLVSASAFLSYLIQWEREAPNVIIGAAKNMALGKVRSVYPTKRSDVSLRALDDLLSPLNEDIAPPSNANVFNFAGGMQVLTDRLVATLGEKPNVTLQKGTRVSALHRRGEHYQIWLRVDVCHLTK